MRLLPANGAIPGLRVQWGIVVFRRVLPRLCQPIVNGRIETQALSGAAQGSPFRSADDADEAPRVSPVGARQSGQQPLFGAGGAVSRRMEAVA